MKRYATDYDLSWMIFLPFMVIISLLYYFNSHELMMGMSARWLFLPFLVYILLSSKSSFQIVSYQDQTMSEQSWALQLFVFIFALCILFHSCAKVLSLPDSLLFSLFPFDFFALFIVIVAQILREKKKGLLSSTLYNLFGAEYDESIGVITDSYARLTILASASFTAFLVLLFSMQLVEHFFGISITPSVTLGTTVNLTSILLLISSIKFRKIAKVLIKYIPFSVVLFTTMLIILTLNYAIILLSEKVLPQYTVSLHFFERFNHANYLNILFYIFSFSWGLLYIGFVVHLSQGRSLRKIIFASLIFVLFSRYFTQFLSGYTLWIAAILSAGYLLTLFLRQPYLSLIRRASLPSESNTKLRPTYFYFVSLITLCSAFLANYLMLGPGVVGFIMFAAIFPVVIIMMLGLYSFVFTSPKKGEVNKII